MARINANGWGPWINADIVDTITPNYGTGNTDKDKDDVIAASRKLKEVGLSHVITITDQKDKDKLVNDVFLKALIFGWKSSMVMPEERKG
jgi:hypothetical protein